MFVLLFFHRSVGQVVKLDVCLLVGLLSVGPYWAVGPSVSWSARQVGCLFVGQSVVCLSVCWGVSRAGCFLCCQLVCCLSVFLCVYWSVSRSSLCCLFWSVSLLSVCLLMCSSVILSCCQSVDCLPVCGQFTNKQMIPSFVHIAGILSSDHSYPRDQTEAGRKNSLAPLCIIRLRAIIQTCATGTWQKWLQWTQRIMMDLLSNFHVWSSEM